MEKVEADGVELGSDGGEMSMSMAEGKGDTQTGSDLGSLETGENDNDNDALDGEEEML